MRKLKFLHYKLLIFNADVNSYNFFYEEMKKGFSLQPKLKVELVSIEIKEPNTKNMLSSIYSLP